MVWTIRNGYRYFEDKSEYQVNRMFRIRGNNEAMVESGMISAGDPFPNFSREEWADYLATIVRYEEAVKRYEMGLEDYEVVEEEYGPVEEHTLPSANKKQKVRHDKDQKVRKTPRTAISQDLNLTLFKRDFGVNRVPNCNLKKRKRFTQVIAGYVKDLFAPDTERLVFYGPHLPTKILKAEDQDGVVDEEMQKSYDILNNCDNLTDQQFDDQLSASIKAYKAKRKARRAAKEAEETASDVIEVVDESPLPQPSVVIKLSDTPSDTEPPEDSPECVEVVDEIQDEAVSTAQPEEVPSTPPQPESPGDFEWLAKITPDPDNPGEVMIRKSPSPIKTPQPVDPLHEPVVYMMPPKHNYPVRPNLDYVKPPSLPPDPPDVTPFTAEIPAVIESTEESKQTKKKAARSKKKKAKGKVKVKKIEIKEDEGVDIAGTVVVVGERQSSRLAEKRVSYAEPEILEDVHFWCWRCKGDVINTCDLHGDLIPCSEVITAPGTKNPLTFPRPSFIDIRRSEIRDAGFGAFATGFIRPGVILGEYKGKIVKRKDYLKIKESGYAWEVADNEGIVSYIDGAGHRASNWLKFVNCCRGENEQNTISRLNQGQIEYYTYKPIAIGHELKIYYGLKYYTDLGYDPTPDDEDEKGEVFSCTKCNKQWNDKEYLDKHKCQANKQLKCNQCDKLYTTKHGLTAHIKAAHLGQGHQCEQCGLGLTSAAHLRGHIATVHEGVKKFNCPFCYYSTHHKTNLTRHVNTHTDTKPHQCPHCDYSCVVGHDLSSHISTQHVNKKYPCQYKGCSVKCGSEEELLSHYHSHPKRQYQCGECPMSFDEKNHLSQHTTTHTGEKNHQCEYCEKKFSRSSNLTAHIRIHTGVKDFKCDNCERQFNRKGNLAVHIKKRVCSKN